MKYSINEKVTVRIFSFDETEVDLNASLIITENYETIVKIYDVPFDVLNRGNQKTVKCTRIVSSSGEYITMIDGDIYSSSWNLKNQETFEASIRSTVVFIGDSHLMSDEKFCHFDIDVTDGVELIGLCPYDVNKNYIDLTMLPNAKEVNIPVGIHQIHAETTIGKWTFYVLPIFQFSKDSLTFKFDPRIHFKSNKPLDYGDFRRVFEKFTGFLEILCGELVTINKLSIHNGDYDGDFQEWELIGFTNYPKSKLRMLEGNGVDTTGFLRCSIFKISDFEDISKAMNTWFEMFDKIPLAHGAYQRILLDEDMRLLTVNKFLSAMQLVEGYSSLDSNDDKDIKEFKSHKKAILNMYSLSDSDVEFIKKYCSYSGITFLNRLQTFTFEAVSKLNCQLSDDKFLKEHDLLITSIKKDRDTYTHSSTLSSPKLDESVLFRVASLYKYFYRINVLSRVGISNEVLLRRLSLNYSFVFYVKSLFDITMDSKSKEISVSDFDKKMWNFSMR